jgi:hypothetical protein
LSIDLGFSVPRLYIGEEASSEVGQDHLIMWRRRPGGASPYGEPTLWPPSGSLSVLVLRPGKKEFGYLFCPIPRIFPV